MKSVLFLLLGIVAEPFGGLVRAAAIAAFLSQISWRAAGTLWLSWVLTSFLTHVALLWSGIGSFTELLAFLEARPLTRLKSVSVPELTVWDYMFFPWYLRHAKRFGLPVAPVTIYPRETAGSAEPSDKRAFPNTYFGGVVLFWADYDSAFNADRFDMYHELGHCSRPGAIVWSRPYGMLLSSSICMLALAPIATSRSQSELDAHAIADCLLAQAKVSARATREINWDHQRPAAVVERELLA